MGFVTDIFMIGLPISLLVTAFFGYDQMHTATGLDVIVHDPKAATNPPNPVASVLQIALFMLTYVLLWHYSGQTPGKKLARIRVVDARTFQNASYGKLVLRFVGYFLSLISIVGFLTGLFRRDKRALHDLISGTAVIREA
ncbi:MAG: RDD family protein [Campylobacterales bacterium]|nr:RDD family protein [Campylobacterales bacterium]